MKRNLESFPISIDNNHDTQLVKKRRFSCDLASTLGRFLRAPGLNANANNAATRSAPTVHGQRGERESRPGSSAAVRRERKVEEEG